MEDLTFPDWLDTGIKKGWIGKPFCYFHDCAEFTDDEMQDMEDGMDPCVFTVRIRNEPESQ